MLNVLLLHQHLLLKNIIKNLELVGKSLHATQGFHLEVYNRVSAMHYNYYKICIRYVSGGQFTFHFRMLWKSLA